MNSCGDFIRKTSLNSGNTTGIPLHHLTPSFSWWLLLPKTALNDSDCRPVIIYPKMQLEACAHLEDSQSPNYKKYLSQLLHKKKQKEPISGSTTGVSLKCKSVEQSGSSSLKPAISESPCTGTRCQTPPDKGGLYASKNSGCHHHFDCITTRGATVKQGSNPTK